MWFYCGCAVVWDGKDFLISCGRNAKAKARIQMTVPSPKQIAHNKMSAMTSFIKQIGWWLYQPYKWLFVYPFFILNSLIFGSVAVLISLVFGHNTGSRLCGINWARLNTLITPVCVRVHGKEHVDSRQSYVIVSNHKSAYDILVVYGWLGMDFKWVMKKEVRKIPGVGFGSAAIGHIFIDRSNTKNALASIHAAREKIQGGVSVLFFPEGTRSQTSRLLPFKKGAFRFALDLGLPVLPVSIAGTEKIMPSGTLDLAPGTAHIVIHPPIDTADYNESSIGQLMAESRKAIERALQSPSP